MPALKQKDPEKDFYNWQNRIIHKARAQLCIDLDVCRELARQLCGEPSLRALSLRQRWELIEILKSKGARVNNPPLSRIPNNSMNRLKKQPVKGDEKSREVYHRRLAYWDKRFPKRRPGFASNKQLAWIHALWDLDFNDGRAGDKSQGLRGFIFRQTMSLKNGPVSDLAFLRSNHVDAVLTPLKEHSKALMEKKE